MIKKIQEHPHAPNAYFLLICDACGMPEGYEFKDTNQIKKMYKELGWKKKLIEGHYQDICPLCCKRNNWRR